ATRTTTRLWNPTHHAASDTHQCLTPGEQHRETVPLNGLAQSFPAGNCVRLSISTSYWPVVWPPPHPVRLTVDPNDSALILPVRPQTDDPDLIPTFGEPEGSAPIETFQVHPGEQDWRISRNLVDLTGKLEVIKDLGVVRIPAIDLDVTRRAVERYTFTDVDVNSVRGETEWHMGFAREDWDIQTYTKTVL